MSKSSYSSYDRVTVLEHATVHVKTVIVGWS